MDPISDYTHAPYLQGPTLVRQALCNYFEKAIPRAIEYANKGWPKKRFLPAPQQYLPYEPLGLSHRTGPIFGVGITGTSSSQHMDFSDAMEEEMMTRYMVRLYLWVYTPETESQVVADEARHETLRVRDDLSTLVRSMLYQEPGLDNPEMFDVQLDTIREEFSDASPVPNNSGRYVAAVAMSFALDVEESLFRPIIGVVSNAGGKDAGVRIQEGLTGETREHETA